MTMRSLTITFDVERSTCATCGRQIVRLGRGERWHHLKLIDTHATEVHQPLPLTGELRRIVG
jgi:hypothetical protein